MQESMILKQRQYGNTSENITIEKRIAFVNHASAHSNFLLELKAKVLLFPISDRKKQQKGATLKGHPVYAQIFAAAAALY